MANDFGIKDNSGVGEFDIEPLISPINPRMPKNEHRVLLEEPVPKEQHQNNAPNNSQSSGKRIPPEIWEKMDKHQRREALRKLREQDHQSQQSQLKPWQQEHRNNTGAQGNNPKPWERGGQPKMSPEEEADKLLEEYGYTDKPKKAKKEELFGVYDFGRPSKNEIKQKKQKAPAYGQPGTFLGEYTEDDNDDSVLDVLESMHSKRTQAFSETESFTIKADKMSRMLDSMFDGDFSDDDDEDDD